MKDRIKQIRKDAGDNQDTFASNINLTKNYVSLLETGARVPSDRTISDICRCYGINEEWLRTGNGEMKLKRTRNQEAAEYINSLLEMPDDALKKRLVLSLCRLDEKKLEMLVNITDEIIEDMKKGDH